MGNSSTETRKMLGFSNDEMPDHYKQGIGKGLMISSDSFVPIAFSVPKIDKDRLKKLLQKKGVKADEPIGT